MFMKDIFHPHPGSRSILLIEQNHFGREVRGWFRD
jgi:hypothetical protein